MYICIEREIDMYITAGARQLLLDSWPSAAVGRRRAARDLLVLYSIVYYTIVCYSIV